MTTDVKLLPLPEWAACEETVADMSTADVREAMADYARANMEPLLAENERLAEALRWIASDETATASNVHSGMDEVDAIKSRARAAIDQERSRGGAE